MEEKEGFNRKQFMFKKTMLNSRVRGCLYVLLTKCTVQYIENIAAMKRNYPSKIHSFNGVKNGVFFGGGGRFEV